MTDPVPMNEDNFADSVVLLSDFWATSSETIYNATNGLAQGAGASAKFAKSFGGSLDILLIAGDVYAAPAQDRTRVLTNELSKTAISNASAVGGTILFSFTGPAAPIFGLAVGALVDYGLNYAEARSGVGAYDLFTSAYQVLDQDKPEIGILTTQIKDQNGNTKFTVEQNSQTGEVKYIHDTLNVTRVQMNQNGEFKTIEITKDGKTLGLNLETGDFNVEDNNGNYYSGNLADASLSTGANNIIGSMLNDFNDLFQQTDPSFDIWDDLVDNLSSVEMGALENQINGKAVLSSNNFVVDGSNSYGGVSIKFKNFEFITDDVGQSVIRTVSSRNARRPVMRPLSPSFIAIRIGSFPCWAGRALI